MSWYSNLFLNEDLYQSSDALTHLSIELNRYRGSACP
jgi:hypothetical protein